MLTRMKKFAAMNKLKKAALLVIAKSLNPDEITGLQQLFRSIDVDNSGTITVDELRTAMRSLDAKLNVRAPWRCCAGLIIALSAFAAPCVRNVSVRDQYGSFIGSWEVLDV